MPTFKGQMCFLQIQAEIIFILYGFNLDVQIYKFSLIYLGNKINYEI